METAILKSISAENFASFAERVVFTCVADGSKKEYAMNTFKAGDDVINKVSYVYGSNGSTSTTTLYANLFAMSIVICIFLTYMHFFVV